MKSKEVAKLAGKVVTILKLLNEADEDVSEVLRLIETCNKTNIITAMGKLSHIRKTSNMMESINLNEFEILQGISNRDSLSQFAGVILYEYRNERQN
jgi:hypothetical protein